MSSNDGQSRKAAGNLLQMKRPHSVGSNVLRFIEMAAQNNACIKHYYPAILVGEFIHRQVRNINVRFFCRLNNPVLDQIEIDFPYDRKYQLPSVHRLFTEESFAPSMLSPSFIVLFANFISGK